MAKITIPLNEDGSVRLHPDTGQPWPDIELEEDEHCLWTSKHVTGKVTVSDGTEYNLSPEFVPHKIGHSAELEEIHNRMHHAAAG